MLCVRFACALAARSSALVAVRLLLLLCVRCCVFASPSVRSLLCVCFCTFASPAVRSLLCVRCCAFAAVRSLLVLRVRCCAFASPSVRSLLCVRFSFGAACVLLLGVGRRRVFVFVVGSCRVLFSRSGTASSSVPPGAPHGDPHARLRCCVALFGRRCVVLPLRQALLCSLPSSDTALWPSFFVGRCRMALPLRAPLCGPPSSSGLHCCVVFPLRAPLCDPPSSSDVAVCSFLFRRRCVTLPLRRALLCGPSSCTGVEFPSYRMKMHCSARVGRLLTPRPCSLIPFVA